MIIIYTVVKPLLCDIPYIVDRRDSEARLTVRLLVRWDAVHFIEMVCGNFFNEIDIFFKVRYLKTNDEPSLLSIVYLTIRFLKLR